LRGALSAKRSNLERAAISSTEMLK